MFLVCFALAIKTKSIFDLLLSIIKLLNAYYVTSTFLGPGKTRNNMKLLLSGAYIPS